MNLKKLTSVVATMMIFAALCGCDHAPQSPDVGTESPATTVQPASESDTAEFDIVAYKSRISDSVSMLNGGTYLLRMLGEHESSQIEVDEQLSIPIDKSKLVNDAFTWLENNSEYKKEDLYMTEHQVSTEYSFIIKIEPVGNEAQEIWKAFSAYYDSYLKFHEFVMSPEGPHEEFAKALNDMVTDLKSYQSKLDVLLK